MKNIFKSLLVVLLFLSAHSIQAEDKAEIFNQVQQLPEQGNFNQQRQLKIVKKPFVSSGHYQINDEEFIWHLTSPIEVMYRITDEQIEEVVDGVSKTTQLDENPQMASFFKVFSALIKLDREILEDNFEVHTKGDGKAWILELVPTKEPINKVFKVILVSGANKIDSIKTEMLSGDTNLIELSYEG